MPEVHLKLNAGFPWERNIQQEQEFLQQVRLELTNNLLNRYIWSIALYFSETWILRKVDQICFKCFDVWRWIRMENISWTDQVRNEEILQRNQEKRNCLQTIKRRKPNWIDHVLRRNCLQNHSVQGKIEGRIEVTERQGKRRKQLLDDFKILRLERGSTKLNCAENSIWEGIWTCRKAYCVMNEMSE